MKNKYTRLFRISGFDVVITILIGLLAGLLFNFGKILEGYGFGSSIDELHHGVGYRVISVLAKIDEFRFTSTAVTFLIWSSVGLIVLLLISSVSRSISSVREKIAITSNNEVNPVGFKRQRFYKALILEELMLVGGLVLVLGLLVHDLHSLWPYANSLIQDLSSKLSLQTRIINVFLGFDIYIVSVGLLLYIGRLTYRRQRFLN